ncbi:MAG: adenine deaminase [Proteobacteria bacterium]|nr:adenine deaminase [Pseudomonadota bacterium]
MREFLLKLAAARGEIEADLLVKNVRLVNVLSGEIHQADVAIYDGRFLGFGDYDAQKTIDAEGLFMAPGFIDGHIHFESTMLTLPEFSRALIRRGTTAAVIDPHEITNVFGMDGIRYVLHSINEIPLDVFVMLPSCVPATPLETSGSTITHRELDYMIKEERVVGIGEMMNFPAVINGEEETHKRILSAKWKKIDGHAPGITGKALNAYIFSNIDSDHESTSAEEAKEKLRKGMHVLIREGTSERNLEELISIVTKENSWHFSFATDDKHPDDLLEEGHLDHSIRKAVSLGMDTMMAYQLATINPANHFNLKNVGAVKPRYWADFVLLSDLETVTIEAVYKKGIAFFENGSLKSVPVLTPPTIRSAMDPEDIEPDQLAVPAESRQIKVIDLVPGQIITNEYITDPKIESGFAVSDIERDILKIVVIERHKATGRIGKAFVRGFGLKKGAIGSTVAHDSHNIVIVGTDDKEIYSVFERLKKMKGGLVAMANRKIVAELPLPIGGLLSEKSFEKTAEDLKNVKLKVKELGCTHEAPFMILSFLSLSPIPKLKVTDLGLIDVDKFEVTSLFVD